jgi:hypothetical protein
MQHKNSGTRARHEREPLSALSRIQSRPSGSNESLAEAALHIATLEPGGKQLTRPHNTRFPAVPHQLVQVMGGNRCRPCPDFGFGQAAPTKVGPEATLHITTIEPSGKPLKRPRPYRINSHKSCEGIAVGNVTTSVSAKRLQRKSDPQQHYASQHWNKAVNRSSDRTTQEFRPCRINSHKSWEVIVVEHV